MADLQGSAREKAIKAKETAIQKRLDSANSKSKEAAVKDVKAQAAKAKGTGKTFNKNYSTEAILGSNKGFTKSDFGVSNGAAIPYQIGKATGKASATATKKKKPQYKPKPQKKHSTYTVKRGDNLSSIASKYGMDWRDIWNYNLKNRNPSAVRTLKKRGPNLIYKGSTFYIPNR